jgi:hypothetical protein
MAGYAATPLWKKLGIKSGMPATVINPPDDYLDLLEDGGGANWGPLRDGVAFVHIFTPFRAELDENLRKSLSVMLRNGMIWASWPKKSSKLVSEITEDTIREIALPLGLVDVKVCAVDKTWSGLKLVVRTALR